MDIVICPNCTEENSARYMYCSKCGARLSGERGPQPLSDVAFQQNRAPAPVAAPEYTLALERHVSQLEGQVAQLQNQVAQLRNDYAVVASRTSTTALQSPNFLSRAFAVWGHYFVAQLLISLGIAIIFFCITAALGMSIMETLRF